MEDDLTIFKLEYLSNHWTHVPQILNLSLLDKPKSENYLKWKQPPIEDGLKILKLRYLSNTDQIFLKFYT